MKLSLNICGENPKVEWTQTKEQIKHLEEEISELQRRNYELEQLSHTEDNLHFLQVYVVVDSQQITNY